MGIGDEAEGMQVQNNTGAGDLNAQFNALPQATERNAAQVEESSKNLDQTRGTNAYGRMEEQERELNEEINKRKAERDMRQAKLEEIENELKTVYKKFGGSNEYGDALVDIIGRDIFEKARKENPRLYNFSEAEQKLKLKEIRK